MYKSSLLSHVIRASKQHPFFSQNFTGANSSALTYVKPKLGLAAEKSYFSSWGNSGQSASNTGGTNSVSQSALIAISSDDNQNWEHNLGLHRKQFRSIAGVRRYSTGTQAVTEIRQESANLQLIGAEIDAEKRSSAGRAEEILEVSDESRDIGAIAEDAIPLALDLHLSKLLKAKQYTPLVELFTTALDSDENVSVTSFNLAFDALSQLDTNANIEYDPQRVQPFVGPVMLLHFYSTMLEKGVLPNTRTYNLVLEFLVRHGTDVRQQETYLSGTAFVVGTPQEEFVSSNKAHLKQIKEINASNLAIKIFHISNQVTPTKYPLHLLERLLPICCLDGQIDDAISIFDHYDVLGYQRSASSYRSLLLVFAVAKDLTGAIECFNTWKRECSTLPEHDYFIIYDALIRCYFAVGDYEGAITFFDSATRENRGADPRWFESIVRYYTLEGRFAEALSFAREKRAATALASSRAFALVVLEACRQGQHDLAIATFREVKSLPDFNSVPSAVWNYLGVLIVNGQLDEAHKLVEDCVREQIELRVLHLSSLITKLLEAGRTRDAFKIAQFIGERRAISEVAELNKKKTSLFVKIFLDDLMRLRLIHSENIPHVIHLLYMLGQNATIDVVSTFLHSIKSHMSLEDWLSSPGLLNELCIVSIKLIRPEMRGSVAVFARLPEYISWLSGVVVHVNTEGHKSAVAAKTVGELLQILDASGLSEAHDKLKASMMPVSDSSGALAQLCMPQHVFIPPTDHRINLTLSAEISKAIDVTEARLFGRSRQDTRIPGSRIIALLKKSVGGRSFVDSETLIKTLEHFGRIQKPEEVRSLLALSQRLLKDIVLSESSMAAAEAILYNSAIIAFNDLRDTESAQKYHDMVLDRGYVPSANAYASFIAKMDEKKYRDTATRAVALFQEAKNLGVRPTEYLFNTVIAKLAKARRNDEALAMFEDMKNTGLAPTAVTYGTVINSCCRVGRTSRAEDLLTEMEKLPKHQNRIAPYNTLLQHFVQIKKDRSKAFYYWEKLRARAITPTAHTYRLLIEAHGNLEPVDPLAAESIIDVMQTNRVRVESIHHAAIIHMYGVVLKNLEKARQYFKWCTEAAYSRVPADDVLYQSMIESCVANGDIAGMQKLLEQMYKEQIEVSAYIANLAIQGFGQSDQLQRARELFDRLPNSGAGKWGKEPSTYESMIRAYNTAAQPERSAEILKLMRSQQYPDAVVHRAAALTNSTK